MSRDPDRATFTRDSAGGFGDVVLATSTRVAEELCSPAKPTKRWRQTVFATTKPRW